MSVRGVRGATVVHEDTPEAIVAATQELLENILQHNPKMRREDLASALFTSTEDLVSQFPASAARQMGWDQVPLISAREIPVPDSLPRCIRVLLHWNTDLSQSDVRHVYLGAAARLRPDLSMT
jgi:chorismate mutase